ncbi:ribonuclease P protein component [Piscirickettsia litoralis]|uniref:Ribonuclease P protein component n=1 Tax=Piscirickettsia litoralis TaxID=1891921 RepID=A0ABX3A2E3_9GAMM|nr:ribonuclease P protein component [Piscirickettsia litoralis]ODN43046.1 ribonuclease P protein component [Piscirickettsia litoralis]
MPAKFSRSLRLVNARDFGLVFKCQRRVSVRGLALYYSTSQREHSTSRLGLAISKKHARRAVSRNLIKRLVRESFRQQSDKLPMTDCVVVTRPGVDKLSRSELHLATQLLFQRFQATRLK